MYTCTLYSLCAVLKIHKDYLAANFNGISDYLNGILNGAFKQFVALCFFVAIHECLTPKISLELQIRLPIKRNEILSQQCFVTFLLNKFDANSIHAICFKANQGAFFYTQKNQ